MARGPLGGSIWLVLDPPPVELLPPFFLFSMSSRHLSELVRGASETPILSVFRLHLILP